MLCLIFYRMAWAKTETGHEQGSHVLCSILKITSRVSGAHGLRIGWVRIQKPLRKNDIWTALNPPQKKQGTGQKTCPELGPIGMCLGRPVSILTPIKNPNIEQNPKPPIYYIHLKFKLSDTENSNIKLGLIINSNHFNQ